MNIKTLTLITTLTLFAANNVIANEVNSNTHPFPPTTLLELMPLVCMQCQFLENQEGIRPPHMAKMKACAKLNAYPINNNNTFNLLSVGNELEAAVEIISQDFSPVNKQICLSQLRTAISHLVIIQVLEMTPRHFAKDAHKGLENALFHSNKRI